MNDFLQNLAKDRQLFLDATEANKGDINLGIFEDFYPDEAHFIFELLQNAEDADATEASFELTKNNCTFEHNGTRQFNEQDIKGITGISSSSKKNSTDKIGKFGVGFKSVFVYTKTPFIYSKQFSFKILKRFLPEEVEPKPNLGERTRFEFPFNNSEKPAQEAYSEVESALKKLSKNTLLFLRNLRKITWKIGKKDGFILRKDHPDNHVEVQHTQSGSNEIESAHWLRYSTAIQMDSDAVHGVEHQQLSVAFELGFTGGQKSFDKNMAISNQLKIVPAVPGNVSVFFPADKETSGLRFHLHAPFIPELSRASIKDSKENTPLFHQLASLTAKSLHSIKKLGLLNGEFLAVLPNNDDQLPERYQTIRKAILDEMKREALVPTYRGSHAPSLRLLQASAPLKALLSSEDLKFITKREDRIDWAIGAPQKNSNQDKLLSNLGIEVWDANKLQTFFEQHARKPDRHWDKAQVDQNVLDWLRNKSDEWLQALYAVLLKQCEANDIGKLNKVFFVKTATGKFSTASDCLFKADFISNLQDGNFVDENIFTTGTKKQQQQDAQKFLEKIGVRIESEIDKIKRILHDSYSSRSTMPSDSEYLSHIERMISFLESNPHQKNIFNDARVFKVKSPNSKWESASRVFLDVPFEKSDLSVLYELVTDSQQKRWPLDEWYLRCGIQLNRIIAFAKLLGCKKEFDQIADKAFCRNNRNWIHLSSAPGAWGHSIDRDFVLSPDAQLLLGKKSNESTQILWNALCRSETINPSILEACYQVSKNGGPRFGPSQLVFDLMEKAWVPQTGGTFVKPRDAVSTRLPIGFAFDPGYKWLQALEFGSAEKRRTTETIERSTHRSKLGFNSEEDLQRALEFVNKFPPDEQARILAKATEQKSKLCELPERLVRNSDRRAERIKADARSTPEKKFEIRERSVALEAAGTKEDAKVYLRDQYTNTNHQMICQVCQDELPFKLPTGDYYFEAVELVADARKRHRETYLALCPNHAAAYRHANGQRNSMMELVSSATSSYLDVALGGVGTKIYFTQTHLADAKACIEAFESE